MSVIIAVEKGGVFVLVADTLFSKAGLLLSTTNKVNHQKIYTTQNSFVGLVGPAVNHNIFESILRKREKIFDFRNRFEIFDTMCALHPILKRDYYINPNSEEDESVESSQLDFLIVNKNGIFEVENHREVNQFSRFWAIGSGHKYALGALHALYERLDDPEEIAIAAMHVSCEFDENCGLPFQLLSSRSTNVIQKQKREGNSRRKKVKQGSGDTS